MEKPALPIDSITSEAYQELREKLDEGKLDDATIARIWQLFGIGSDATGRVNCDEYHQHSYSCIQHYHPTTAIVHRLVNEVRRYQSMMKSIEKLLKEE